jgi:hypothetical protein
MVTTYSVYKGIKSTNVKGEIKTLPLSPHFLFRQQYLPDRSIDCITGRDDNAYPYKEHELPGTDIFDQVSTQRSGEHPANYKPEDGLPSFHA